VSSALIVLETALAIALVMGVGALLRRVKIITEEGAASMARVVADVAFPALCLDGLAHASGETLRDGAVVAGLGFGTLAVATGVGIALVRLAGVSDASRPTAVFAIAIGNWIFLPLPVAEALHGTAGTTTVILNNVGAQLFLWTFGIAILERGKLDRGAVQAIARSPGLWATLAGIGIAVSGVSIDGPAATVVGVVGTAVHAIASLTIPLVTLAIGAQLAAGVVGTAVHAIASLTIPLVTLAIGAQLAAPSSKTDPRALGAVVVGRLALAPLAVVLGLALAQPFVSLPPDVVEIERLIAAMPVSLSAAALVQRHRGDTALVSRAILVTTLLAIGTAPLWMLAPR
jgi:predicted permease